MKIKLLALVLALSVLTLSISSVASAPKENKATEPLDKVTFIHYKDGKVSVQGRPAKTPSCYKLLGVKWKSLPVSYVINPGSYPKNFVTDAISLSTAEWDSHTSASLFDGYTLDNSATWDDSPSEVDYMNEYVFGPYPQSNVIAVTNIWYTRFGRQIVDYDVLFNTYYTWGDAEANPSVMDLQNIATHETGHGLGLADIYSGGCSSVTMYGYSDYGETQKRTLEQPDITGLQKMYGA